MKKSYSVLEIEAFRNYVICKESKQYLKALYWSLKHKYYEKKAF